MKKKSNKYNKYHKGENNYSKRICNNYKCCKGEKGERGSSSNYVCTLISVKNPQSELIIPDDSIAITEIDLFGWTDIVPDALNSFDNVTGTFTAFEPGDYVVTLVVNYETSVPLATDFALTNVPTIEIYDVDTREKILGSQLSAVNLVIPIPPMSSGELPVDVVVAYIVARAIVTIDTVIPLKLGQRIRTRALTNGLIYAPIGGSQVIPPLPPRIIFTPQGVDTTLTIYKIRNSPIVTINCNN